jgi:hypothetical protein
MRVACSILTRGGKLGRCCRHRPKRKELHRQLFFFNCHVMEQNIKNINVGQLKSTFTEIDVAPYVILVITDHDGAVLGVISGESRGMPKLLRDVHETGGEDSPVRLKADSLTPLGQDIYTVSREFLLGLKSVMWNWDGAKELEKILPIECCCTLIVNY